MIQPNFCGFLSPLVCHHLFFLGGSASLPSPPSVSSLTSPSPDCNTTHIQGTLYIVNGHIHRHVYYIKVKYVHMIDELSTRCYSIVMLLSIYAFAIDAIWPNLQLYCQAIDKLLKYNIHMQSMHNTMNVT